MAGSGSGYLKSMGDYVHLNLARANLVVADAPLKSFAWSSWPAYLLAARARETPGVVAGGSVAGRVGHARGQSGGAEEGEEFKPIRRGWCLGEETFREKLLTQMSERMGVETTMTVGWIAERLAMGTRGYLNHLLYRRRKLGGE